MAYFHRSGQHYLQFIHAVDRHGRDIDGRISATAEQAAEHQSAIRTLSEFILDAEDKILTSATDTVPLTSDESRYSQHATKE